MKMQDVDQLSFDFIARLPVVVQSHRRQMSGDAGLLPIRQFDGRWRYTQRLAGCLEDSRCTPMHTLLEMTRQRVYGILADYEDCNDHDTLRDDPIFKLVADRRPDDDPLASQPTLCRFENATSTPAVLLEMIDFLIDTGIERLRDKHGGRLPERVTLDLDPTDDPCHGDQQLGLFHGYYGQDQYLPLIISEPTTRHVFLAWLRPGTLSPSQGADDDLLRVATKLRAGQAPGRALAIHVRGDADFGTPTMLNCCEKEGFSYTFGLRSNPALQRLARPLVDKAQRCDERTGSKQRRFMRLTYQAKSWPHPRTVIAKAEYHAPNINLRFVVTNLPVPGRRQARQTYDAYVQRGESEQRMDELKNGLHADRLSCHRFLANFFRLLMHTAAFNLLNGLRDHAEVPQELRRAQPATWRTRLIKVAATIVQTTRRVIVELAAQWPFAHLYHALGRRALQTLPAP